MKPAIFTKRYRTAAESRKPGYLARRFEAIRRLQRRCSNVTTLKAKGAK
jgi:uncharacterized protein VirK/YbjX